MLDFLDIFSFCCRGVSRFCFCPFWPRGDLNSLLANPWGMCPMSVHVLLVGYLFCAVLCIVSLLFSLSLSLSLSVFSLSVYIYIYIWRCVFFIVSPRGRLRSLVSPPPPPSPPSPVELIVTILRYYSNDFAIVPFVSVGKIRV